MPLPEHDEVFKALINDVVCPVLESASPLKNAESYGEIAGKIGLGAMLACTFIKNGIPEVEWNIDEVRWYELINQSKFQAIQSLSWLSVPISVIDAIEN